MYLELVSHDDPILKMPALDFDFANPQVDPVEFAKALVKKMVDRNGLGLAAPQVGVRLRVFAMRNFIKSLIPNPDSPSLVLFNPKVVWTSDEQILLEEGCLSFPNLFLRVRRPKEIRVRFTNPNGSTETIALDYIGARCALHEIDHLDGVTFDGRGPITSKEKARKWKQRKSRSSS